VLSPLTPTAVPASACDAVRYMICKIGPERPDEKEFAAAAAGHSVFLPSRTQLGPHRSSSADSRFMDKCTPLEIYLAGAYWPPRSD
jgi:hypothetical protein